MPATGLPGGWEIDPDRIDADAVHAYTGGGRGKALVAASLDHPALAAIPRWTLNTSDAQGLYAAFGFGPNPNAGSQMVLSRPTP